MLFISVGVYAAAATAVFSSYVFFFSLLSSAGRRVHSALVSLFMEVKRS